MYGTLDFDADWILIYQTFTMLNTTKQGYMLLVLVAEGTGYFSCNHTQQRTETMASLARSLQSVIMFSC